MCLTAGRYFIVLYSLHGSVVYVLCVLTLKVNMNEGETRVRFHAAAGLGAAAVRSFVHVTRQ